jgi:hypothetical protein
MYLGLHVKYLLFSLEFNKTWSFSTDYLKILEYQIPRMSVQSQPSCSVQTDRKEDEHADMLKLIVAFRNFAKAPDKTKGEWIS